MSDEHKLSFQIISPFEWMLKANIVNCINVIQNSYSSGGILYGKYHKDHINISPRKCGDTGEILISPMYSLYQRYFLEKWIMCSYGHGKWTNEITLDDRRGV